MAANLRISLDGLNQIIGEILRVRRHKAYALQAIDLAYFFKQGGKALAPFKPLAVGIHILPEQHDFFYAVRDERLHLAHNILRLARLLSAAHIGDDAVGAKVIATVHDVHARLKPGLSARGHVIPEGISLFRRVDDALILRLDRIEQFRKLPDVMCSEDKIHEVILLLNPQHFILLLHHAAADADQHVRIQLFKVLHNAEMPVELFIRVLAHRAGIKEEDVRVLGRNLLTADFREYAGEFLRIARIHLTAHRCDVIAHRTPKPLALLFNGILQLRHKE